MIKLECGDSAEVLKQYDDNTFDSIVTDSPYGISFLGKSWDYELPPMELWQECLRTLKPGGHLINFSSSRTYHRMAVTIEDAGFEIRDQLQWVYYSGFPKAADVGKMIDKKNGITNSNWYQDKPGDDVTVNIMSGSMKCKKCDMELTNYRAGKCKDPECKGEDKNGGETLLVDPYAPEDKKKELIEWLSKNP